MSFLRRLLGRDDADREGEPGEPGDPDNSGDSGDSSPLSLDEEERAHELELARFEQDRTTDLVRRQQRYSDRSWTPPAQGGPQRADTESADES